MRMKTGWNAKVWIGAGALVVACLLLEAPAAAQVSLNVFGDIDYQATKDGGNPPTAVPASTTNAFSAPRVELFLTATQGKLAFLTETMFEVGEANEFGVDIERIEVGYLFSDMFRFRIGRFHTAIGYYNDAYHHGRYFQTTVDRPTMVRFEDEGGLIPAHSVGVHIDGRFALGGAGFLRYDGEISNGRGVIPDEVTNLTDPNNGKMFNLRLRFEPAFLDGLIVGASGTYSFINTDAPAAVLREYIVGGHVAYLENRIHVIGEYLYISHENEDIGWTGVTQSAFLELGYELGKFIPVIPYLRGEWVRFPAETATNDPFFARNALFIVQGSSKAGVAGVRVTLSDFLALKLEGEYVHRDIGTTIKTIATQCAYAF